MVHSIPAFVKCLLFMVIAGQFFVTPASAIEVYFFKGAGDFSFINKNMHFSRGLERMADQLNKEGIHAEVRRFGSTGDALRTIRRRRPQSVAFVGHSMGALASMNMARKMKSMGIRVAYVGTIDIPGPIGSAGNNVEWAENYFSVFPVYGKLTNTSSHRKAKNIYVFGQIHTTMDDSKKVRRGVLSAIRKISRDEQGPETVPEVQMMVENNAPQNNAPVVASEPVRVAQTKPRKRLLKIDEDDPNEAVGLTKDVIVARAKPRKRLLKIDEVDPNDATAAEAAPITDEVVIAGTKPRQRLLKIDEVDPNESIRVKKLSRSNNQFASAVPVLEEIRPDPAYSSPEFAPVNLLNAPSVRASNTPARAQAPIGEQARQPVTERKKFSLARLGNRGRRLVGKVRNFLFRNRDK